MACEAIYENLTRYCKEKKSHLCPKEDIILSFMIIKLKRILPKEDYKVIINIVFMKKCHLCPSEDILTMPIVINIKIQQTKHLWVCKKCYKLFEKDYKRFHFETTLHFIFSWRRDICSLALYYQT